MTPEALAEALDLLGWDEFYELQSRDEHPERGTGAPPTVPGRLAALGERVDPALLDQLARTPGYLAWALRLCPYVAGADCRALAREHADSPDHGVRYWAQRLLAAGGDG